MIYLFGNLIGIGLGPWAAGVLSDALRPWLANESLRYAMLLLCPVCVWSAWHLWAASKSITRDVERLQSTSQDEAQRAPALSSLR